MVQGSRDLTFFLLLTLVLIFINFLTRWFILLIVLLTVVLQRRPLSGTRDATMRIT
jgi:hypothetical protein